MEKSTKKRCKTFGNIVVFLLHLGIELFDCISDWLFFFDVKAADIGIVYGKPDQVAMWCLLAFCLLGSVFFFVEMVNLGYESFGKKPWVDSEILAAVVTWLEDVPQVIISLYLVMCREDPISLYQLIKACLIITGTIVQTIGIVVKNCKKDPKRPEHHKKIKAAIALGALVQLGFAVAIFVLTQTERDSSGTVSYRVPTTIVDDQYNDQHYFANVSIFVSYTNYFDANKLDPNKSDSVVNWLRLTTINKLRATPNEEIAFNIQFQQDATGVLKMAVWEKLATVSWTLVACYTVNSKTADVQSVINTTCANNGYFTNPSNVFIKFRYQKPDSYFKNNILGDIYVNMKVNKNGQCRPFSDYRANIEESLRDNVNMTLHYYRTNLYVNETNYMKHSGTEAPRFFRNTESDMTDVKTAWKTGWMQCEATGHTAPVLNIKMDLDCSMN